MKKVLILYKYLPQWRQDFFEQLKSALIKEDIELHLVYGKLKNVDSLKNDEVELSWATYIPNRIFRIGHTKLIWQPGLKNLKGMNLVIVEQANKLLLNYCLMFGRFFSSYRFAYWGHGRNRQDDPKSLRNIFKYTFIKNCDWWFAYTKGVRDFLISKGFPENKITIVQNAIETSKLRIIYSNMAGEEIAQLKEELGITGQHVGLFCGGMYPYKRLGFVLDVCKKVRESIPDFHVIFIGSGIDSEKVKQAAESHNWIHYVGPKFGNERVKYFKLASLELMPGLVGLGIVDSFALETPIYTTAFPYHSPEIEYLENNYNGIITADDFNGYCQCVIDALKTGKYLDLIEGCRKSAELYTLETMVENFKKGIISCLNAQ
jgi:L-malate glycosyltransferase